MLLRTATFAMGTRFELVLEGRDPAHARAAAEAALAIIEETDARYSRFRSDSLISRVNREANASPVRVDPETFELLARCAELRRVTEGAFDVCVGTPMDRVRASSSGGGTRPLGSVGAFELDPPSSSVRFTKPGTALDLGGIGKGHALDLAAASLRDSGIGCALLHGGTSSVIALGSPPTQPGGWRVALGPGFGGALASLSHRSLSLSAVRGNSCADQRGPGAAHVLDPHRGALLACDSRALVAMGSARDAEAWSTALLVLAAGEGGLELALSRLSLPHDFEGLVADAVGGVFAHAATKFEVLSFLPSMASAHAR